MPPPASTLGRRTPDTSTASQPRVREAASTRPRLAGDSHCHSDPGERPTHRQHGNRPRDAPMTMRNRTLSTLAACWLLLLVPATGAGAATATFSASFEAERSAAWNQPRGVDVIDCRGQHYYAASGTTRRRSRLADCSRSPSRGPDAACSGSSAICRPPPTRCPTESRRTVSRRATSLSSPASRADGAVARKRIHSQPATAARVCPSTRSRSRPAPARSRGLRRSHRARASALTSTTAR